MTASFGCDVQPQEIVMTEKKPDKTSDDARTGKDADKNREELVKKAEKGLEDAHGNKPKPDQISSERAP
jgi:hypothetical protein